MASTENTNHCCCCCCNKSRKVHPLTELDQNVRRLDSDEASSGKNKCRNFKDVLARERWKLLAKVLSNPNNSLINPNHVSVRRFSSFGLIAHTLLDQNDRWMEYSAYTSGRTFTVNIHHIQQHLTASELMGYNNTGNVCVWPSEEVLAYFLLGRLNAFAGRRILELGGGMTCLAGLFLAKYVDCFVHLTDGNELSAANVSKIVQENGLVAPKVTQLQWCDAIKLNETYDVILCADCLFFDDARADLVEALWQCLLPSGLVLVMAPRRAGTLEAFVKAAQIRGFRCRLRVRYSTTVWTRHLHFQTTCPEYDADLHYPLLLFLTKPPALTEYWVSTGRKYCEFCKVYTADNKPSIQFHENGKKHKEAVRKRLEEMQKKAKRDEKMATKLEETMRKIEQAALEAYERDKEENLDMGSTSAVSCLRPGFKTEEQLAEEKVKMEIEKIEIAKTVLEKKADFERRKAVCVAYSEAVAKTQTTEASNNSKWREAKTGDGLSYYWNIETKETQWLPPEEGFKTLELQEKEKEERLIVNPTTSTEIKEESKEDGEEGDEEKEPVTIFPPLHMPRVGDPYGMWKTVVHKPKKSVDLQLPATEPIEEYVTPDRPAVMPTEKPEKLFKEKVVSLRKTAVKEDEPVLFKKRKIVSGNVRRRDDDDS